MIKFIAGEQWQRGSRCTNIARIALANELHIVVDHVVGTGRRLIQANANNHFLATRHLHHRRLGMRVEPAPKRDVRGEVPVVFRKVVARGRVLVKLCRGRHIVCRRTCIEKELQARVAVKHARVDAHQPCTRRRIFKPNVLCDRAVAAHLGRFARRRLVCAKLKAHDRAIGGRRNRLSQNTRVWHSCHL